MFNQECLQKGLILGLKLHNLSFTLISVSPRWTGLWLPSSAHPGFQLKSVPSVTAFPFSSEEFQTNKVILFCMIQDFHPSNVAVAWKAMAQGVETTPSVWRSPVFQRKQQVMASSYLTMTSVRSHRKGALWRRVCPLQTVPRSPTTILPSGPEPKGCLGGISLPP
jgi:hypothetical protein